MVKIMKKSLLTLSAAAIALSGMAATPMQKLPAPAKPMFDRSVELKSVDNRIVKSHSSSMKKAPAKISEADVIYDVEGNRQNMMTTASGYFMSMFGVYEYEDLQCASYVVYGENDEIYFYDIVPNAGLESFVKGVRNGDKVEVSLPQIGWYNSIYGYGLELCLLKMVEPGDDEYLPSYEVADEKSVTFTIAEDGSMVADGISEDLMLGYAYTDDLSFSYCGVSKISIAPFDEKIVDLPEDYEVSNAFWLFDMGDYGYGINWAQGYDDVYFQGLWSDMPDAWVKGTVEYDDDSATISIAQNQVLGIYSGYYVYTKCAKCVYDEDGELIDLELMPEDYPFQMVWDFEENSMTVKDPDMVLVFNAAKDRLYYLDYFIDIKLIHQDEFDGTPVNPYGLEYSDENFDYYECYEFYFTVPAVSTEGDMLNTDDLYYVIYVDGEEWELDAEEYGLEENMVEIPWGLSSSGIWNFGGAAREVDFYIEGVSTIGVQSVYKYNGEETRSEIVTIDVDLSDAVKTIAGKKVASVKYYGLDGREVANPAAGIFVKRMTFEDGTTATYKLIKK